jgi:hypothetical protein
MVKISQAGSGRIIPRAGLISFSHRSPHIFRDVLCYLYSMKNFSITILVTILSCFSAFSQSIGGIGAQLKLDSSGGHTIPVIQKLVPNSPAAASLKENYFIIKVDGNDTKDKSIEAVVGWIRGNVGTPVKMTVADNKAGKHSEEYTLVRASIAAPPDNAGIDPVNSFYAACESEVKQMKRKGTTIIKTFNSECGDYFFNFDGEAGSYSVRMWILQDIQGTDKNKATVRVFENNDEKNAILMGNAQIKLMGGNNATELSAIASFRRETVATISVQLNENSKNCRAIFIVVTK